MCTKSTSNTIDGVSSCDQPDRGLARPRLLDARRGDVGAVERPVRVDLVLVATFEIGWPTLKKLPSGLRMPAVLVALKITPEPPWTLRPGKRMLALV